MRRLAIIALLFIPLSTWSQVVFDAFSDTLSHTDDFSFVHTPVAAPTIAIVGIMQAASGLDRIGSTTYGNVAMNEFAGSPLLDAADETSALYLYYLFGGIPTGAQPVEMDATGTGAKTAFCMTFTSTGIPTIIDIDVSINSGSDDDPQVTLQLLGRNAYCLLIGFSGQADAASITPFTNWTARKEFDFGAATALAYSYDILGEVDVVAGWTQTADDAGMIAIAFSALQGIIE